MKSSRLLFRYESIFIICLALILVACAQTTSLTPTDEPATPTGSIAPTAAPTQTPAPAALPTAASLPQPTHPLQAWGVAPDDGSVYALDKNSELYLLTPVELIPQAVSQPLFNDAAGEKYLAVGNNVLFVGSAAATQTLVLNRSNFNPVAALNKAGPMALDPDRRLFLLNNKAVWVYNLADLNAPPAQLAYSESYDPELGYGSIPIAAVTDLANQTLYIHFYDAFGSPPHNPDSYRAFDLDSLDELLRFNIQPGTLSRPAIASESGGVISTLSAKNGFLGNKLIILDEAGEEIAVQPYLNGLPANDAAGEWIYLLRDRGLWTLRGDGLSLQSIFPFNRVAPLDLILSPNGDLLYLFGNGWLTSLKTAGLQNMAFRPLNKIPPIWLEANPQTPNASPARLYQSPQYSDDETAFLQLSAYHGYTPWHTTTAETWRATDGGQTWRLLLDLTYPNFAGVQQFSLSPEFAADQTLVARTWDAILRSTDGGDSWAAWSPPIAFTGNQAGNNDIYLMDQTGNNIRQITTDPAGDETPAWSPAWTRLAFASNRGGNWDIYSIRAGCAPPPQKGAPGRGACDLQQLTANPADDLLPAWSPDGKSIAFVSLRDGNPEIYLMDAGGQNQRRLTFSPGGDWRPAWHPDNQHLYFTSDRGGNNDIYRLTAPPPTESPTAETEVVQITAHPADDRDPAINAQGQLIFLSNQDGFQRTFMLDLRDSYGRANPFTAADRPEAHPSWIDGPGYEVLIALEEDSGSNIYKATYPAEYTPLTADSTFNRHPAWGPVWWNPVDN